MRGLSGKRVIVTGSGRGIGRGIARRLAAEGAVVVVNDVDESNAEETVSLIESEGGEAITGIADVADFDAVETMVSETVDELGGVDVLVNNAGWDRIEWFTDQDPSVWDRLIDINLRGQINCSRAVADYFVDSETEGTIVNISSDAGRVGSSGEAVYAGCKGGVIAFTKTLARELARNNVNCNVIAPGPADTPLVAEMREDSELGDKILGSMENQVPLGRMAEPADIAGAVAFMASEDAAFVTGQVLSVSGGLTMVD
ncbi:SDR family NAD(P)-dependent oxidoreductase [Natrinema caseinilyticum]|uniref:SDR family NAD(P)-dependent oxidoreductase n=1 Tax=Natrinema caseinilyticum TaxID=2961570 RepID=UPI0020C3029B|nr:glucose 1-dehydrogenase [Natrinema caseinilyticum]